MALIYAMALGADCIDDCDVLRAGRTGRLLGGWIAAPSTLGTFLWAFTFGHVHQLDRVSGIALTRAWNAGARPGSGRLVVDIDSFIGEIHGYAKHCAAFGYTAKRGCHPMLVTRGHRRGLARASQEGVGDWNVLRHRTAAGSVTVGAGPIEPSEKNSRTHLIRVGFGARLT